MDKKETTAVKSSIKKLETKAHNAPSKQTLSKLNIIYSNILDLQFDGGIRYYKDGVYIKLGDIEFPNMFKFYKPWEEEKPRDAVDKDD